MCPIYEYRCPVGHEAERLRKWEDRDNLTVCALCQAPMNRILSAHHTEPDGIYSYEPNIGSADAFERKRAGG